MDVTAGTIPCYYVLCYFYYVPSRPLGYQKKNKTKQKPVKLTSDKKKAKSDTTLTSTFNFFRNSFLLQDEKMRKDLNENDAGLDCKQSYDKGRDRQCNILVCV